MYLRFGGLKVIQLVRYGQTRMDHYSACIL